MPKEYPRYLTLANNLLFFAADQPGSIPALWQTDGTPEGTIITPSRFPASALAREAPSLVQHPQDFGENLKQVHHEHPL